MQRAEKILIVLLIVCAALTVALVGILVAYNFMRTMDAALPAEVAQAAIDVDIPSVGEEYESVIYYDGGGEVLVPPSEEVYETEDTLEDEVESALNNLVVNPVVNSATRIIFERNYVVDGLVQRSEERLPHFAVDMDRDSLAQLYEDWEIVAFSPAEVVMRRDILAGSYFSIGEMDGFVAAFSHDEEGYVELWSLTRTPLVTLPPGDQVRIREGIVIHSEEALMRLLQDFES